MDTMAERLKHALTLRGMTPGDLIARKVLSKAGIYFLLDGTTSAEKVRASTVTKLSRALQVNQEWLQYGRGPIEGGEQADEDDGYVGIVGYSQAVGLGAGAEADEYAETHKLKFKSSSLRRRGIHNHPLAVYYGKGDSMEPTIKDGDAILFDTSDTRVVDGLLYVIQVDGMTYPEYFVKRALVLDGAVYFQSDNPAGDHNWRRPRRMDSRREPITVIGRVHWIGAWAD
ncbi:cI repressor protein [Xanthomonas sp. NCPPB 1128]|uniref:S24 family peptidase n=1 Tax=Xanthomonas sp. NCPPB 1128 TaxID=1775876 RepID=UPI00065AE2AC|nr:S24 family peptidase [Xanthomonas sp. NCPPB 1128]KMM77059.1 cI repressor protein [Xanthomonas sp. NCPPB 1128]KMM77103.1 cI repressor protein [Xanthomonas sp. NCPPB 1128]